MGMLFHRQAEFVFIILSFKAINLIFILVSKFLRNLYRHLNYDFTLKSNSKKLLCIDNVNTFYNRFFRLIMQDFACISLIAKTENSGFQDVGGFCL